MVLKFFAGLTNLEDISDDELLPQPSDGEENDEYTRTSIYVHTYKWKLFTSCLKQSAECSFKSYLG